MIIEVEDEMKKVGKYLLIAVLIAFGTWIFIPPSPIYMFIGGMQSMPKWQNGTYGEALTFYVPKPDQPIMDKLQRSGYNLQVDSMQRHESQIHATPYRINNLICGADTVSVEFSVVQGGEKLEIHMKRIEGAPSSNIDEYKKLNTTYVDCFTNQIVELVKK